MNAIPNLDVLLDPTFSDMRSAVRSAFEIGRKWGRQEAALEMKAKVAAALDLGDEAVVKQSALTNVKNIAPDEMDDSHSKEAIASPSSRAPRGSVRPAVMKALSDPIGATQVEIVRHTGANENSVRGILNTLRNEGLATKSGDVWTLTSTGDREVEGAERTPDQGSIEADEVDAAKAPSSASVEELFG